MDIKCETIKIICEHLKEGLKKDSSCGEKNKHIPALVKCVINIKNNSESFMIGMNFIDEAIINMLQYVNDGLTANYEDSLGKYHYLDTVIEYIGKLTDSI